MPGADRHHTGRHSFSFGSHYDPDNTHHGLLLVSNDDRVRAGTGFGTHGHKDMEIVTWVLSGRLEHDDSAGVHQDLDRGQERRAEQHVQRRDKQEVEHEKQHAVHRVLRADHQHGEPEDARRNEVKRDRLSH